jgi:hypothetical protein
LEENSLKTKAIIPTFTKFPRWYQKKFDYYLYYWNNKKKLIYITKLSRIIGYETTEKYRSKFGKLNGKAREVCIIAMESQVARLDASLTNSTTTGVTFLTIVFSLFIVFSQSIFHKNSNVLPYVIYGTMIFALLLLIFVLIDIGKQASKRAHLSVILFILKEKDVIDCTSATASSFDKWSIIERIGELNRKGFLTDEEFQQEKDKLFCISDKPK